ncbi:MAG: asparagine--tRNA ligase [Chlamydiia bacterium]|nr:asparagine--tRNA ligase [Chlamydiia bacterium]
MHTENAIIRSSEHAISIKHISEDACNCQVKISGWIKSIRDMKNIMFISINDGSCVNNIQCVVSKKTCNIPDIPFNTGSAISLLGTVVKSKNDQQSLEVNVNEIIFVSSIDGAEYPMQKKTHSLEFIRSLPHLRAQTYIFSSIMRVKNAISFATHKFFQENDFLYVQGPLLTSLDCEGAGETFSIDDKQNIFNNTAHLTVSSQLHIESLAVGLGKVYSFAPTFRAENSNTTRHLSEFWMIEPEISFCNMDMLIDYATNYIKYVIKHCLEHCKDDILSISNQDHVDFLESIYKLDFPRISYTEAVEIINSSENFSIVWGQDIGTNEEKYLTDIIFKNPVIVTDYPRKLKPFYMKQSDSGNTVKAIDILMPGIGEIIGGSQREDIIEKLESAMLEKNIDIVAYDWYLDLRRFGNVPHAGFGLGLERLVMFITSSDNIRDMLPYPRYPGRLYF